MKLRTARSMGFVILLVIMPLKTSFSNTIAGNNTIGSTSYPTGGMRRVNKLTLSNDMFRSLYSGVYDGSRYAYFGTAASLDPGWIIKVDLGGPVPVEVGAAQCHPASDEFNFVSAAIDPAAGYAYFGTTSSPGRVVKVRLDDGNGMPKCLGSQPLNPGENAILGMVIDTTDPDPANHFLLAGTAGNPGIVVKLTPGAGDNLPSRLGAVTLNGANGEASLRRVVLDTRDPLPENHAGIFATGGQTAVIIKVAFGAGNNPVRIGATIPDAGDHSIGSAVIDPLNGFAYFGTYQVGNVTARIIKVALNGTGQSPTRAGHLMLAGGEIQLCSVAIDPAAGIALFGTDHVYPADLYKIDLHTFTEMSKLTLQGGTQPLPANGTNVLNVPETLYGEVFLQSAVTDPDKGYAFWGTDSSKGQIVKVGLSAKGAIRGIRIVLGSASSIVDMNFYAHTGAGNVRLGIYDDTPARNLLWQSSLLPVTPGWMTVPIAAGAPASLNLDAGTYSLAWQVDNNDNVASYSQGIAGEGWFSEQPFGPFPSSVSASQTTDESWSIYVHATGAVAGCSFADDFEDGFVDLNRWTILKQNFTENGGDFVGTPSGRKAISIGTGFAGCGSNCTIDTYMETAGGGSNKLWLLGWYQDKRNTVELLMKQENGKWILRQKKDGFVVAKAKGLAVINSNQAYHTVLTYNGSDVILTVDGTVVANIHSSGALSGSIGYQVKNTIGRFADLCVR